MSVTNGLNVSDSKELTKEKEKKKVINEGDQQQGFISRERHIPP